MGFILMIIVWILTPVLEVGNLLTGIWVYRENYQFLKFINKFFSNGAIDRDRFGNHNYRVGLNFWFSNGGYQFGNKEETISSALGKKSMENSLAFMGWFFYYLLYALDYSKWKKGGHCFASINNKI